MELVSEGRGRLIKTIDKRTIIALPKGVARDSQFPFPLKINSGIPVKVSIDTKGNKLTIEKWTETLKQ